MLVIRPSRVSDEEAIRAADRVMDPFAFSLDLRHDEPFARWLARREREERGEVPAGRVRAAFRVAEVDGVLAGRVSIRYALNDWLARYGGHVGYGVLPGHRRRGIATALLRHALGALADDGVARALVVCAEGNAASAAVAERCGGVVSAYAVGEDGSSIRHYRVPTTAR